MSEKAETWLAKRGIYQKYPNIKYLSDLPRHEPLLVECVEELGAEANGYAADLMIVTITTPCYYIDNYDGQEAVIVEEKMQHIETKQNMKKPKMPDMEPLNDINLNEPTPGSPREFIRQTEDDIRYNAERLKNWSIEAPMYKIIAETMRDNLQKIIDMLNRIDGAQHADTYKID